MRVYVALGMLLMLSTQVLGETISNFVLRVLRSNPQTSQYKKKKKPPYSLENRSLNEEVNTEASSEGFEGANSESLSFLDSAIKAPHAGVLFNSCSHADPKNKSTPLGQIPYSSYQPGLNRVDMKASSVPHLNGANYYMGTKQTLQIGSIKEHKDQKKEAPRGVQGKGHKNTHHEKGEIASSPLKPVLCISQKDYDQGGGNVSPQGYGRGFARSSQHNSWTSSFRFDKNSLYTRDHKHDLVSHESHCGCHKERGIKVVVPEYKDDKRNFIKNHHHEQQQLLNGFIELTDSPDNSPVSHSLARRAVLDSDLPPRALQTTSQSTFLIPQEALPETFIQTPSVAHVIQSSLLIPSTLVVSSTPSEFSGSVREMMESHNHDENDTSRRVQQTPKQASTSSMQSSTVIASPVSVVVEPLPVVATPVPAVISIPPRLTLPSHSSGGASNTNKRNDMKKKFFMFQGPPFKSEEDYNKKLLGSFIDDLRRNGKFYGLTKLRGELEKLEDYR